MYPLRVATRHFQPQRTSCVVIGVLSSSSKTAIGAGEFSRARYEKLVATVLDSSASSLTMAATATGEGESELGTASGESGEGVLGRDEVGVTGSRCVIRRMVNRGATTDGAGSGEAVAEDGLESVCTAVGGGE